MVKRIIIFIFIALMIAVAFGQTARTCVRVVDGDTIVLNGEETVRLIGVDTPETKDPRKPVQYFGEESYQFTKKLVEGNAVYLEYDQQRLDKYGRTLAYVYLTDGTCVNSEIIKQGYGMAYIKYPFKYLEQYLIIERGARTTAVGLWGSPSQESASVQPETISLQHPQVGIAALSGPTPPVSDATIWVYVTHSGSKYHTEGCRYIKGKKSFPLNLGTAVAQGYEPCSVCKPPIYTPPSSSQESFSSSPTQKVEPSKETNSSDRTIMTGPRGGKYYINSKGKKVYIKKKK